MVCLSMLTSEHFQPITATHQSTKDVAKAQLRFNYSLVGSSSVEVTSTYKPGKHCLGISPYCTPITITNNLENGELHCDLENHSFLHFLIAENDMGCL